MVISMGKDYYHITVTGFNSGLNELLAGRIFDQRKKMYRNIVKNKNDKVCSDAIRFSSRELYNVHIFNPIVIHYKFYCKDKRRDRTNVASAFDKSFEDALQKCSVISDDKWDCVLGVTYDFAIDKKRPRVEVVICECKKEPVFWKGWEVIENELN